MATLSGAPEHMIAATPRAAATRYPALDLIRAFSAVSILVFHVIAMSGWQSFPDVGPLIWFRVSFLRVDLFFVVSGFVIALAAMREHARGGAFRRRFFGKRLARLAPAYAVSALAWLALNEFAAVRGPDAVFQIFTHIAFLFGFFPSTLSAINGVTWTIGIEIQFYLLMALLMPWLSRWVPWRVAATVIVTALAWRLLGQWQHMGELAAAPDAARSAMWFWSVQAPGMGDVFGVGLALALVARSGAMRPLPAARWIAVAVIVLAYSYGLVSALRQHGPDVWPSYFWGSWFRCGVVAMVAGWLWLAVAMPHAWASALPRWARYPGRISYGIFLWHVPVTQWLLAQTALREWSLLAAALVVTGLFAAASWHWIESPFSEWAKRRLDAASAQPR